MAKPQTQTQALTKNERQVVDETMTKIQALQHNGKLHLPADYSAENALQSAALRLRDVKDKNGKAALEVCTRSSIACALLDMVVQGLNPEKKQIYFIVYGTNLTSQRSYFGSVALAKRADTRIADVRAQVIYEGDKFSQRLINGQRIIEHEQTLESMSTRNLKGAYAVIVDHDGEVIDIDVMAMAQIKQSWRQSKMNPVDDKGNVKPGSTHGMFPEEMAKKTVINHAVKLIVNTSNDHYLKQVIAENERSIAESEAEEEILTHENADIIDIEPEPVSEKPALPDKEEENPGLKF